MNLEIIQEILDKTDKKVIQSDCKKILKKLSFKSSKDTGWVTELAVWLYVFGYYDYAIAVANLFDTVEFDGNYTLWENIKGARLLKARILRERGKTREAEEAVQTLLPYEHPKLYKNASKDLDLYARNIESNIEVGVSPQGWQLVRLETAIKYRELKGFPMRPKVLEKIIAELIETLSEYK